jgi:hypothetical protein
VDIFSPSLPSLSLLCLNLLSHVFCATRLSPVLSLLLTDKSEEPLAEMAALEIQSTRSSMSIEGKMLLGHTHPCRLVQSVSYN